jgi:hypothetical protein
MFGLFKSQEFTDPQLGKFLRSRGLWRGTIPLGSKASLPLVLSGTREAPDAEAMRIACSVGTQFPAWRPAIETALYEHYLPYAEAGATGRLPSAAQAQPRIETPAMVWSHVSEVFVAIMPLDGVLIVEIGYSVTWDEEHTLGARIQGGRFIELCGSVLVP